MISGIIYRVKKDYKMQLIQGDCLTEMKNIPDKSIDLILTDPPYGTTACKWDIIIPLDKMWIQLKRIIKDNGAIVLFGSQPFTSILITSNLKMFKYCWIWDKSKAGNIFLANSQPMKVHEDIIVFGKDKTNYYPIKIKRDKLKRSKNYGTGETMGGSKKPESKIYEYDDKFPESIINFSNAEQSGKEHPTQKPISLMEYLIKTYTIEKEIVLDFTMGSGTTGFACKQLNRDFIGIELDPMYFKIAETRIKKAVRQEELFTEQELRL